MSDPAFALFVSLPYRWQLFILGLFSWYALCVMHFDRAEYFIQL